MKLGFICSSLCVSMWKQINVLVLLNNIWEHYSNIRLYLSFFSLCIDDLTNISILTLDLTNLPPYLKYWHAIIIIIINQHYISIVN